MRPWHVQVVNTNKSSSTSNVNVPLGGLAVSWFLGDDPSTITTKAGDVRTVIELRDPARLSRSVAIWLDGDGKEFEGVRPGAVISLHLESVRSGRGRGELVAEVDRPQVEAAFKQARGQQ